MTFMQSASMARLAGHLQNILICFSEFSITQAEAQAETQAEAAVAAKNSRQRFSNAFCCRRRQAKNVYTPCESSLCRFFVRFAGISRGLAY